MSFNPIKCVVLRISTKKKKVLSTQYELHGHALEVVDSSKYLGDTIKDDLSWGTHIQNTVSKANRTLGFLRRNMKDCTKPVKDLTYKAMIRPTMEYASAVWTQPYKLTSQHWSRCRDERLAMSVMTTIPELQDLSPR